MKSFAGFGEIEMFNLFFTTLVPRFDVVKEYTAG